MKVAQIGLGAIGSIFARHLREAGVELVVHDLSSERVEAAVKLGARGASSLNTCLSRCPIPLRRVPRSSAPAVPLRHSRRAA